MAEHKPTKTQLLSDIFLQKNLQKWPIKVNLPGWRKPHQSYANWVEKLSLKHAKIWELTGICDGILSSLHEIKPNPEIILAVTEFWCSKTNTFIFPWGEATITLEDVNVLSGLPVFGETVNDSRFEESSKNHIVVKLHQVKNVLSISSTESDDWIGYFNEENDEIEHVGFLVYWLSMFVFPVIDDGIVGLLDHVFSIAVSLARGVKIALAPAVLACLYQNLTFLTNHAADFDCGKKEVSVPGLFQIVQLWALERFPVLGSKLVKQLSLGQPRIARWDNVSLKASLVDVRNELRSSGDSFCWRPYCLELENWRNRSLYLDCETEKDDDVDEELRSVRVFLQPSVLIGIDCTESYQSQRVAMQFGCCGETVVGGNDSLVVVEKSSDTSDNKLWEKSMSARANRHVSNKGLDQEGNENDHKKQMILCDKDINLPESSADISPKSEILNVSGDENVTKQNFCVKDEEQSLEGMVIADTDDEMDEKLRHEDVIKSRRSAIKLKRRIIGDSADYPLYITEYSRKLAKKEKRSGISFGNPIDVENYWF